MAKHWTKVRSDIITSTRMAALLDTRGPAYGLYIQAKAVCDDYGRLPADPRKFKAKAAPMSDLSLQEVGDALAVMEQIGVTRTYTVGGERFIEIVSYNDIESTDWRNVGLPEYPHPPDWTPPQSLTEFLDKYAGANGIYHERYGLTAPRPKREGNATEARPRRARSAPAPRPKREGNADAERLACEAVSLEVESETESEENGLSRAGARTTPPALAEQETEDGERPTALAREVRSAARSFYGTTDPPGGWERYEQQMAEQLAIAGDRLTPQEVAAAFDIESPLRPRPGEWADKFLCRLIAERERSPTEVDEQELETGRKRSALALQLERAHQAGDEDLIENIEEQLRAL